MIRLLCVEDDPLVRAYVETRLAAEPDIHVVGTAGTVRSALMYLRYEPVDVVLLDYQLSDTDGMYLMETIADWDDWSLRSDVRPGILFCTGYADDAFEALAQARGAHGIVAKHQMARDLIPAVRVVAEGGYWVRGQAFSPAATTEAVASSRAAMPESRARLD